MASLRRERCLRAERRPVPPWPPCAEPPEALLGAYEAGPAKAEEAARLEGAARLMAPPSGESCRPRLSKEAGRLSASPADSGETKDTDRPLAATGVTGAPRGTAAAPPPTAPPLPAASAAKREGGRRTGGAPGERARGGVRAPAPAASSSSWNSGSSRRLASEPARLSLKAEARSEAPEEAVGEASEASEAEPEVQGHSASSSMLSIATTPSSAASR